MKTTPNTHTKTKQKTDLLALTLPQLQQWFVDHNEAAFRAKQLFNWLYQHLCSDFSAMSNLPQALRSRLTAEATIGPMIVRREQHSKDDRTRKILLELCDGKLIESVLMLYPPIGERRARSSQHVSSTGNVMASLAGARATVCVSTQADRKSTRLN